MPAPEVRALALTGALLLCVGAVFLPASNFGFVNWDDDVYVTANPVVQGSTSEVFPRILTEFVSGNYHPLTIASFALERRLFGERPEPHHVVNLLLHLANTALVLLFLRGLGTPLAGACAGALLWAIHPLRVEPVAWITGRKDLLATLFSLGSLLAWLSFRREGCRGKKRLSAGLFLLALLSKGTAIVLPALLLLVDLLQGLRPGKAALREKAAHFALAAAFATVAIAARGSYQGVLEEEGYGLRHFAFLAAVRAGLVFLLRSVVPGDNPAWLYPDFSVPLLEGPLPAALGLLAAAGVAVALSLRRRRVVAFGLLFFLVSLLPALPLPVLGFSADRFTYLPAVGIAYLCGEFVSRLLPPFPAGGRARRAGLALGVAAVALLLARQTGERLAAWADSESLWSDAIGQYSARGVSGRNLALAHRYRARARLASGETAAGLEDYAAAVRIHPASAELRNEQGIALASAGAPGDAVAEFTAALALEPSSAAAAFNRGVAHLRLGNAAAARADFSRALASDPGNTPALLGRARSLLILGVPGEALRDADEALDREPGNAEARELRAAALAAGGAVP